MSLCNMRQRGILEDLEHLQGDCVGDEPFGCAPLVDCAHAAHDLLEARLFLT